MADIAQDLANIKAAVYGAQVRDSIHDAIRDINDQVENSETSAANSAADAATSAAQAADSKIAASDWASAAASSATDANNSKNDADAYASQAATSASQAAASAEEARDAAYGQVYADSIPISKTDATKIVTVLNALNEVVISFTSLQFTQSGSSYVELIENSAIKANYKPGLLLLTDERARSSSPLTIETANGQLTLTLSSAPPSGIPFSGELHLNKAG